MFREDLQERLDEMKEVNALYKEVIEDVIDNLEEETKEGLHNRLDEISSHGCASGIVSSMIYYSDTIAFFERHKYVINDMIAEFIRDTGLSMSELFKKFDNDDPLCLESNNQNLLAWWSYEYVISDMLTMLEEGEF